MGSLYPKAEPSKPIPETNPMQPTSSAGSGDQAVVSPDSVDIQLLVLDIDGTIAGESNLIRQPVQQAIQAAQAKGVQVAIATGRMYCSALRFHQIIGSQLPLITYQGALIKDPASGRIHHHRTIPRQTALQLLEYFERVEFQQELSVHFYINDQLYVRALTPETQLYAERSAIQANPVGDLRNVLAEEPTKILALSHNSLYIDGLLSHLRELYTPAELYLTTSVSTFFEATNPLVNKGAAVQYLAEEILGLQPENVMTVGDNFNDIEMLQYAGLGVAMGNAPEGVKAVADWVAPQIELDGAAAAIEQFVL